MPQAGSRRRLLREVHREGPARAQRYCRQARVIGRRPCRHRARRVMQCAMSSRRLAPSPHPETPLATRLLPRQPSHDSRARYTTKPTSPNTELERRKGAHNFACKSRRHLPCRLMLRTRRPIARTKKSSRQQFQTFVRVDRPAWQHCHALSPILCETTSTCDKPKHLK